MSRLAQRSSRLYRVDPRLLHATLMNPWVPLLRAEQLLVVDDEVMVDPRLRTILEMSAMETPLTFVREEDARAALARLSKLTPVIVLFGSLAGAERALNAGVELDALNIGHLPEGPGRQAVLPAVHLGTADLQVIRRLQRRGVEVYIQPLPRDPRLLPPAAPPSEPERPAVASRFPAPSAPPPPRGASVRELGGAPAERVQRRLQVVNERGLHLRAAHALAHLAGSLPVNVQVSNGPDFVNAKSLLGLTTLGAACGTWLDVCVMGPEATDAMERIQALFAAGFGEGVKDEPAPAPSEEGG